MAPMRGWKTVGAPPERRSSRREEAHFSNAEYGVRNAELSQSLLASAATVQGFSGSSFLEPWELRKLTALTSPTFFATFHRLEKKSWT